MYLKIFILKILLGAAFITKAQYFDPAIINCAGKNILIYSKENSKKKINWILDWNIGETLATESWCIKNKLMVSSGFLQPKLLISSSILNASNDNFNLIWGPNPVNNYIQLASHQLGIDILSIEVKDAYGNIIQQFKGPFSAIYFSKKISMASANTGIYFIVIHYFAITTNKIKIIKVIKI